MSIFSLAGTIFSGGSTFFASIGVKIGLVLLGISMLTAGFFYIQSLRHELHTQEVIQAQLRVDIQAKEELIKAQTASIEKMRVINTELNVKFAGYQKDLDHLRKTLEDTVGKTKELNQLALKKPKELEVKLNQTMQWSLRCNQLVTGAPADASDVGNTICPALVKIGK